MTDTALAAVARAPHADGLAVFDGVLDALQAAGWTRLRVDTLTRPGVDYQIRHQFNCGVWEFHLERQPPWQYRDGIHLSPPPGPRCTLIDLHRPPLPTVAAVLSELFGPHTLLAQPRPGSNGKDAT